MTELRFPDGQVLTIEATGPDLVFTAVLPPGLSGLTHAFGNPFDEPARIRTVEHPAGPLLPQLEALQANGGRLPLLELARINAAHDVSLTIAGIPDGIQRLLWRALAAMARAR